MYAYAAQSPTLETDEHGEWAHIAIAAAIGAVVGGVGEAVRQYAETGHVENWGQVGARAAATGVAFGLVAALPTPATVAEVIALGAGGNALTGVAN